jgi:NTE family protein
MTRSIVRNAFAVSAPDIYVEALVKGIAVLEFWRVREILAQAEVDKDAFKRAVDRSVESFIVDGARR